MLNRALFFILALAVAFPMPGAAQAPASEKILEIDSRTTVRMTQVSGLGRSASFYRSGTYAVEEPALYFRKSFAQDWRSSAEFRPRFTNDKLTDQRGFSIETLSMEVRNSSHVFSAGDYFAVMSQYSMSQLVKGAAYQRNFRNEENYLRAAIGAFDGQWEYLYKEDPNEPMDRRGGGLRGQLARDKYRMGLNWAFVQDDRQDSVRQRTREDAYYQNVGAFDWEWRPGTLTLDGEHAAMVTTRAPLNAARTKNHGHANRIRIQGNLLGARLQGSFENVAKDFTPLAGSASSDRRRYNLQADRRLTPVWRAFAKFSLSHDDLEGSNLKTRTTLTNYDLGVTRTKLFGRKSLEASLAWRRSQTDTRNYTRDKTSDRLQVNVSDQLTKTLRGSILFEPTLDKDHSRGTDARHYFYEVRLSDRRRLPKSWSMNTTLSGRERDTDNLVSLGYDRQRGGALRLDFSRPGGMQTGAEYDISATDLFNGTDSRTDRGRAFFEFKPKVFGDMTSGLEYNLARYRFSDPLRNYDEHHVKLSLTWKI